jgi:hypothetical protein
MDYLKESTIPFTLSPIAHLPIPRGAFISSKEHERYKPFDPMLLEANPFNRIASLEPLSSLAQYLFLPITETPYLRLWSA